MDKDKCLQKADTSSRSWINWEKIGKGGDKLLIG